MNRRKILTTLTGFALISGLIFAAVPFLQSMNPSDAAREKAKVVIRISELPENRALEVDYRSSKAFVVKNPSPTVFLIPYWNEAYRLPDPTWERAIVPCEKFIADEKGFSCEDLKLQKSWNEQATWSLAGRSEGSWMPNLKKINFSIEDGYLILSPEYE